MLTSLAPRRRRLGFLALLLTAILALTACTPEQQSVLDHVNNTRSAHGLTVVLPSAHAMNKAQAWAEHLAGVGELSHSDLAQNLPDGWTVLGENVGKGANISQIHDAFMNSEGHRANILDERFNWMGTGHAVGSDGFVYVVHVFARY